MDGFKIIKQEGRIVLCNHCERENEINLIGIEIPMVEFDGLHYNIETGQLTFDYPVWGNFDCSYCGIYNGYVFINDIAFEIETINT